MHATGARRLHFLVAEESSTQKPTQNDGISVKRKARKALLWSSTLISFQRAVGTQANLVFLSCALKAYEAVIARALGHINVHETATAPGTGQ